MCLFLFGKGREEMGLGSSFVAEEDRERKDGKVGGWRKDSGSG